MHPSYEKDWTPDDDWKIEARNRQYRNCIIRDMLHSGRSVQYRSTGSSLAPMVKSNDVTMWEPVKDHSLLKVNQVVFCLVQPGDYWSPDGRFYGHVIHNIGVWTDGVTYWEIGNLKNPPHINGWCNAEHIFGVLMEVSPIQYIDPQK